MRVKQKRGHIDDTPDVRVLFSRANEHALDNVVRHAHFAMCQILSCISANLSPLPFKRHKLTRVNTLEHSRLFPE